MAKKKNRKVLRKKRGELRRSQRGTEEREYNAMIREAERRIKTLQRARVDYWAMSKLEKDLGTLTLEKYGTLPKRQQERQKRLVERFLNSPTSQLREIKNIREKQLNSLEKHLGQKINNTTMLYAMFDSALGQYFKDQLGSTEFVDKFVEASNEEASLDGIMMAFQEYEDREIGWDEITDTAKQYDRMWSENE